MEMKELSCRVHSGGKFTVEKKAGRPPVSCTAANPCTKMRPRKAVSAAKVSTPERVASKIKNRKADEATVKKNLAKATGLREEQIVIKDSQVPDFRTMDLPALKAYARKHFSSIAKLTRRGELIRAMEAQLAKQEEEQTSEVPAKARAKAPEIDSEPRSAVNRSVAVAQAARAELEAIGWTPKGRGWTEGEDMCAELTATRGKETIVLTWRNGTLVSQDYSLWPTAKVRKGAMPKRRLKFNPDEMTDGELIRAIAGMRVVWWNALAQSEESFTVGTKTLSIEHTFASNGDEDTARRIVKFVDMNGGGFRHFHVDALLKVG